MYGQNDGYGSPSYGARNPIAFDLMEDAFGAIDSTYAIDEIDLIDIMDDDDDEDFGLIKVPLSLKAPIPFTKKAKERKHLRKRGRRVRKQTRKRLRGRDTESISQRIDVLEAALRQPGNMVTVQRKGGRTHKLLRKDVHRRLKMMKREVGKRGASQYGQDVPESSWLELVPPALQPAVTSMTQWFDMLGPKVVSYEVRTGKNPAGDSYTVVNFIARDPLGILKAAADQIVGIKNRWNIVVSTRLLPNSQEEMEMIFSRGTALDAYGFLKKGGGGGGGGFKPLKAISAPFKAVGKGVDGIFKKKENGRGFRPLKAVTAPFRRKNGDGIISTTAPSVPSSAIFPTLSPPPVSITPASAVFPSALPMQTPPAVPHSKREKRLMGKQLRQERRGVKTSAALQRESLGQQIKQIKKGGISFGQYDLLGASVVEDMFE